MRKYLFDDRILSPAEVAEHLQVSSESFAAHGHGIWLVRLGSAEEPLGFAGLLHSSTGPPNLIGWYGTRVLGPGSGLGGRVRCPEVRVLGAALGGGPRRRG